MEPTYFKIFLTVWFSIGILTSIAGFALNLYTFSKGFTKSVSINLLWIVNTIIIYGLWNWL